MIVDVLVVLVIIFIAIALGALVHPLLFLLVLLAILFLGGRGRLGGTRRF